MPSHARGKAASITFTALSPFRWFVLPLANTGSQRRTNKGVRAKDGMAVDPRSIAECQGTWHLKTRVETLKAHSAVTMTRFGSPGPISQPPVGCATVVTLRASGAGALLQNLAEQMLAWQEEACKVPERSMSKPGQLGEVTAEDILFA